MTISWIAQYNDNSSHEQLKGFTYSDIKRDMLKSFVILYTGNPILILDFTPDSTNSDIQPKRLIYRIRHRQTLSGKSDKIYLVGWQRKVKDLNIQSINYITESGLIVQGGQFIESQPLTHAIQSLPFETDLL